MNSDLRGWADTRPVRWDGRCPLPRRACLSAGGRGAGGQGRRAHPRRAGAGPPSAGPGAPPASPSRSGQTLHECPRGDRVTSARLLPPGSPRPSARAGGVLSRVHGCFCRSQTHWWPLSHHCHRGTLRRLSNTPLQSPGPSPRPPPPARQVLGRGGCWGGLCGVTSWRDGPGPGPERHTSGLLLGLGVDTTAEAVGSRGPGLTGPAAPVTVTGRPGRRGPSGHLCSCAK